MKNIVMEIILLLDSDLFMARMRIFVAKLRLVVAKMNLRLVRMKQRHKHNV